MQENNMHWHNVRIECGPGCGKRTAQNVSLRRTYVFGRSSTLACQCTPRPIPVAYQLAAEALKWATSGLISMTKDFTTFYTSSFQAWNCTVIAQCEGAFRAVFHSHIFLQVNLFSMCHRCRKPHSVKLRNVSFILDACRHRMWGIKHLLGACFPSHGSCKWQVLKKKNAWNKKVISLVSNCQWVPQCCISAMLE